MQLKKLTTRYVVDEDRFLISGESEQGVINLWLTQRILKQLLPHVIQWMERKGSTRSSGAKAEPAQKVKSRNEEGSSTAPATSLGQTSSQLAAQHRQPVAEVRADMAVQESLVRTLQFQPRDNLLCLKFELADEDAVLLLEEEHARIWLGVVYRHWNQAEWPDIWPEWIKQAERLRHTSPVSLMH